MNKIFFVIFLSSFFIFASADSVFSQTADEEISLPRDVVEKSLKALEENPLLRAKIAELETQLAELNRAKQTPCTLAIEKVKLDLDHWLAEYRSDIPDGKRKQIDKNLALTRRLGKRSIAAQCGFKTENQWLKFLDIAARFSPALVVLLR